MKVTLNFKKGTKVQDFFETLKKLKQIEAVEEISLSTSFGARSNLTCSKMVFDSKIS